MASCFSPQRSFRNFLWCMLMVLITESALAQAPTAPTGFSMPKMTYFDGNTQVWRLEWADNSTVEDGYRIYFRYGGAGPVTLYQEVPFTGTLTNVATTGGSTTVTCASTVGLSVGWTVSGANIASSTVVASITNATTFVLSAAATGSGSGLTLSSASPYRAASGYTYAMNMGVSASYFPGYYMEWWVEAYNSAGTAGSNSATFGVWPGGATVPATPTAPTGVTVTTSGDGRFNISFSDNSNSESYFELAFKKTTDVNWASIGIDFGTTSTDVSDYQTPVTTLNGSNAFVFLPYFLPATSYDFMIRAVDWNGNVSAFTSVVSGTTQAFKAPTSLTATRVGENSFDLSFTNNSTAESGYEFQFREQGSTTWNGLGVIDNPFFSTINTGALNPNTNYEFQARAFIREANTSTNPVSYPQVSYTAFSNTAATASTFNAPTNLAATSPGEGLVDLTWTDNSSAEGNYEVQVRLQGETNWQSYNYLAANTTSLLGQLIAPGETLEFRVRATFGSSAQITSDFSNIATISTAFHAPTGLTATASTTEPYRISFEWTDNSGVESDYELQVRKQGDTFVSRKVIAATGGASPNTMTLSNLPEFDPGSIYEFRIRARYSLPNGTMISTSAFSNISTTTTLDGFSSRPYAPITMGAPFSYQMATMSQATRTGWSVGTLPAGLLFDSLTGIISGTPTVAGLFSVPMTVNFSGGGSHVLNLALRIQRPPAPPVIVEAIGDQLLAPGGSTTIGLNGKFSDLDTESAVRVTTTVGTVDVILYPSLTPGTVTNFLSYDYSNVVFHRAPTGFVVQGGGYKVFEAPNVFESITRQAAITNEPGISNLAGTVAMAKLGDDPNSATSEFFFSLGNNSSNLDNQNGGFSVFGRVSDASRTVLTTLGSVPTSSYAVKLRTNGTTPAATNFSFTDIPINQTPVPAAIDQSLLVKINSVTPVAVLSYAITTHPDSAVATAVLNGTDLEITSVGPGNTSLVVSATDVDGNSTPQTININVSKLPATITLENLTQTYDGTARVVTAATNPVGLQVDITYGDPPSSTAPTAHGSYPLAAVINDATYTGSQTGTLIVRGIPFSEWRALRFTQGQIDGGLAADDADADGDGIKNFVEYALGTGPNDAGDVPSGLTPVRDGNGLTLTFTRPKDLPDVVYGAESTDSLAGWGALTVELVTDGPVQTLRVRDPLTSGNPDRRFIRLIFNRPAVLE